MSHTTQDPGARAMSIGLVAYGIDGPNPSLVFVRVPTERGRWILTDRCVVEVPCRACGAAVGEPCRRGGYRFGAELLPSRPLRHGACTHAWRRTDWQNLKHTRRWRDHPKLRMPAKDLHAAQSTCEESL